MAKDKNTAPVVEETIGATTVTSETATVEKTAEPVVADSKKEAPKKADKNTKIADTDQADDLSVYFPSNVEIGRVELIMKGLGEEITAETNEGMYEVFAKHFNVEDKFRLFVNREQAGPLGFRATVLVPVKYGKQHLAPEDYYVAGAYQVSVHITSMDAKSNTPTMSERYKAISKVLNYAPVR